MGEYAKYGRDEIKIGTCENMYYLRHEQRWEISPLPGNVNPQDSEQAAHLRFRFPFPEEDGTRPGAFRDYSRGLLIPGFEIPELDHGITQFVAQAGFNVCLPCPESKAGREFSEKHAKIHRNGYPGAVSLVMQRMVGEELQAIVRCNGCGNMFRLDREHAERACLAFRGEADHHLAKGKKEQSEYYHKIADRIWSGYSKTA